MFAKMDNLGGLLIVGGSLFNRQYGGPKHFKMITISC